MQPSDEEFEWHEFVRDAERENFRRVQRACRPLWQRVLEQILRTSGQFAFICLIIAVLLRLWVESSPPISWP